MAWLKIEQPMGNSSPVMSLVAILPQKIADSVGVKRVCIIHLCNTFIASNTTSTITLAMFTM